MKIPGSRLERVKLLTGDQRGQTYLTGLDQLPDAGLARLQVASQDPATHGLILDGGSYDSTTGGWCALAVGLRVPDFLGEQGLTVSDRTSGLAALREIGAHMLGGLEPTGLSGVPGEAFTTDRLDDLQLAVLGLEHFRAATGAGPNELDGSYETVVEAFGQVA